MSDTKHKEEHNHNVIVSDENHIPKSPQSQNKMSNRVRQEEHFIKERERASSPILSSSETTPLSLSTDIIKLSGPLFVADHGSEHLNSDIKVQKIENAQYVTVKMHHADKLEEHQNPTFFVDQNNAFIQEPVFLQHHQHQHHHVHQHYHMNQKQQPNLLEEIEENKFQSKEYLQELGQAYHAVYQQQVPQVSPKQSQEMEENIKGESQQYQEQAQQQGIVNQEEKEAASKYIQQQWRQKTNIKAVIQSQKEKALEEQNKAENNNYNKGCIQSNKAPQHVVIKSVKSLKDHQLLDIQHTDTYETKQHADTQKDQQQIQQDQCEKSHSQVQPHRKDIAQEIFKIEDNSWKVEQPKVVGKNMVQLENKDQQKTKNQQGEQEEQVQVLHQQRKSSEQHKIHQQHNEHLIGQNNSSQQKNSINDEDKRNEQLEMIKRLVQEKKQQQLQQERESHHRESLNLHDNSSKWDIKEKEVLMKLVEVYGQNDWSTISAHIPHRTPACCKDMFDKLNSL